MGSGRGVVAVSACMSGTRDSGVLCSICVFKLLNIRVLFLLFLIC